MDRIEHITSRNRLALGLRDAAESVGVSVPFMRLEIKRGRLRASRLGRRLVVTTTELQRYLDVGMKLNETQR